MKAIQELENIWQGTAASRTSLSLPTFDAKALQDERDVLAQKCHEAEVSAQQILFNLPECSNRKIFLKFSATNCFVIGREVHAATRVQ